MATIKEVAARARASVGTVSHVLHGKVPVKPALRARILAAISELNYVPNHVAQSLARRRSMMLGMVIPDITNPFFPQVVRGAEDVALQHGYFLVTFNTDDHSAREKQVLAFLRARQVDGILLVVAPDTQDVSAIQQTIDIGTPIVCLDRIPAGMLVDSVAVDNVKGAAMCTRHLIERGHTRIAFISGDMRLEPATERFRGFEMAMGEAGLTIDPELVGYGDFRAESGHRLSKQLLLTRDRPTAIFCSNGMMCLGAIEALDELGLECPNDCSLASFDDLPFSGILRPKLTSVAQPAYEIGSRAARLLLERLNGTNTDPPCTLRLEPELKVRHSTALKRCQSHETRQT